jgi:hypothetical protein
VSSERAKALFAASSGMTGECRLSRRSVEKRRAWAFTGVGNTPASWWTLAGCTAAEKFEIVEATRQ